MSVREHLHQSVQAVVSVDEGLPEGAMLLGWVTVAEWMAPSGERWLSCVDGGVSPDRGQLPDWQRQGYLHNALHDHDSFGDPAELDDE